MGVQGCRSNRGLHLKNEDSLLQSTLETQNILLNTADHRAQVNGAQVSSSLGHWMVLPRGGRVCLSSGQLDQT